MGSASSIELNSLLSKEQTKTLAGSMFSEELWARHASSSGFIHSDKLLGMVSDSLAVSRTTPVLLLPYAALCRHGQLPRCPDDASLLVNSRDVDLASSLVIYVSHVWYSEEEEGAQSRVPDTTAKDKYHLCVEGVRRLLETCAPATSTSQCYLWLDYSCLNQDKNSCEELKALDSIYSMCHCMLTPISDPHSASWDLVDTEDSYYSDYKAKHWQDTSIGYLNRAWCRLEMLYCKTIPLSLAAIGDTNESRFRGSLRNAVVGSSRRQHYIFGHREFDMKVSPLCLPPLTHTQLQQYDPLTGNVTLKNDLIKIKSLLLELKLLFDSQPKLGYRGSTNSENKPHGEGVYSYSSGNVYAGSWKNGKKHGRGRLIFAAGDVYDGEYKRGKKQGVGTFYWLEGDMYSGQWIEDRMHGEGTFYYANGNVYQGIVLKSY